MHEQDLAETDCSRAKYYREKARQTRAIAGYFQISYLRAEYEAIADLYDELAAKAQPERDD